MTQTISGSYPQAASGGGSQWWTYSGGGTPTGISGAVNNDLCLRSDGEVFKLVSGAWTDTTVNIKGVAGSNGSNGSNGATGATGPAGTAGDTQQGVPALNGLLAQTWDAQQADITTSVTTSGRAYFQKVYAPSAMTITNLVGLFNTAGATLSYGRMAILNSSGTMLSITADLTTTWATSGNANVAQICPVQPTAGGSPTPYSWAGGTGAFFYVGYLFTGTTTPQVYLRAGVLTNLGNVNTSLAAGNAAYSFQNLATLNGPVTWTSGATSSSGPWIGVS